jgi:hypothetical protein
MKIDTNDVTVEYADDAIIIRVKKGENHGKQAENCTET